MQTTALPNGLTLRAGADAVVDRLPNDKHAHTRGLRRCAAGVSGLPRRPAEGRRAAAAPCCRPAVHRRSVASSAPRARFRPAAATATARPGDAVRAHRRRHRRESGSWRAGLSYLWARSNARESTVWGRDGSESTAASAAHADARSPTRSEVGAQRQPAADQPDAAGGIQQHARRGQPDHDPRASARRTATGRSSPAGTRRRSTSSCRLWRVGVRTTGSTSGNVDGASNGRGSTQARYRAQRRR